MKINPKPKQTLTMQAYEIIKNSIFSGSITPGTSLSENELAAQLGMSRTPIREALRILESQDYVEIRDGLGTFVKSISLSDILELFEARKHLEVIAAASAHQYISIEQIDAITSEFEDVAARWRSGKKVEYNEFSILDIKLHGLIIDNCKNKYIRKSLISIMDNIKRIQHLTAKSGQTFDESLSQHLELLRIMRTNDTALLQKKLEEHIIWSCNCMYMK